jgi:hypothetical protein
MTVDAVNSDIFDDDKITGIVCVWFVGERLERVRSLTTELLNMRRIPETPKQILWKSRVNTRRFSMRWSMH